jgi:pyruvate kinase
MKFKKVNIEKMIGQLDDIRNLAKKLEEKYSSIIESVYPDKRSSAINLLHYLALRHHDISDLQDRLGLLGISRLGRAESHVMASIMAVKNNLKHLLRQKKIDPQKTIMSIRQGRKQINRNTTELLGKKLKGSKVRIMVTLPTEAASNKSITSDLLTNGMNSARINCAHDNPEIWAEMIRNIRKAQKKSGRNCKICMDLGGPKLRTGEIEPGPKVIHLRPQRDLLGNVIQPADLIIAAPGYHPDETETPVIPVEAAWIRKRKNGEEINFRDTRKKKARLIITHKGRNFLKAKCSDSVYIIPGMRLYTQDRSDTTIIGDLPALENKIILNTGDILVIHKEEIAGNNAEFDQNGKLIKPAHISCSLPEIFENVYPGESIFLDDGKISSIIREVSADRILVEIVHAKEGGAKLKADKGINLPESRLNISGLTAKDRQDLDFVAGNADTVNLSFVNEVQDVIDLHRELDKRDAGDTGIVLKIETMHAFTNLPALLLTAMSRSGVGVMLARGDLAIEVGWRQLACIQEEIMWMCEAAHVPVIWATQVLETLAKKGLPSRAEITDAAMAQRAECVMLNKGPHIVEAIRMLDDIMFSMQEYHNKQAPMMPLLDSEDYLKIVK